MTSVLGTKISGPGDHASGPEALLQASFLALAEALVSWRLRSYTGQQLNLAVAWIQFTAYKTNQFPVQLCAAINFWNKLPMHQSGSWINCWLRLSGKGLSRIRGTAQGTASSSPQKGFPTTTQELLLTLGQHYLQSSPVLSFLWYEQYHLQFPIPSQQFPTANHIFHPPWLRAYVIFHHFTPCYSDTNHHFQNVPAAGSIWTCHRKGALMALK